jgi:transposase InsO family protein
MKYACIHTQRGGLPIDRVCRLLRVSGCGYYAWQKRQAQPQPLNDDVQLVTQIQTVFEESRGTYGSPQVTAALRPTTDSRHPFPIAPNRLQRDFNAQRPNEKWLADITYVRLEHGFVYLEVILDAYTRVIRGWALGRSLSQELTLKALDKALATGHCPFIFHSDQGSQYAARRHTDRLLAHGIHISMSDKGCPQQNGIAERSASFSNPNLVAMIFCSFVIVTRSCIFNSLLGVSD